MCENDENIEIVKCSLQNEDFLHFFVEKFGDLNFLLYLCIEIENIKNYV